MNTAHAIRIHGALLINPYATADDLTRALDIPYHTVREITERRHWRLTPEPTATDHFIQENLGDTDQ